ncbi:hypothetical protein PR202_gb10180 [Eleusine coracana subsp. coracana]|uniref:PGRL1A transmembrane protein n=1 Tax=Eleusine coracana subsp. coracana TaxID=191504 RepID=A0AAV5EK13_ELECO|nr:hypothetical protein PR202_gb10180 [Eleusine coracana subsp. coracana]
MASGGVWLSPTSRLPSLANFSSPSSRPSSRALPSLTLRRRSRVLLRRATEQQGQVQQKNEDDEVDSNVLPYCSLDRKQKKTIGEMEQEFLQALQSFYYDQKAIMSNEEFDNLKEELMWEGSSVVMLSPDEQRLLEASMAYAAGNPIMSDAEFDELKLKLKVYSDLSVDYLKMFLLNVPATVVALGLFFFFDELTGFEINVFQLPEPFGFIFTWFAALPLILFLGLSLTNAIIKDFLILKGPCPNCGAENVSFFGTILCSTDLVYDSKSRLITLAKASEA